MPSAKKIPGGTRGKGAPAGMVKTKKTPSARGWHGAHRDALI